MKKQAGFTLIELVVVIVILGILAAVAIPKFVDLSDEAKEASAAGVAAAASSAMAINYAGCAAKGGVATPGKCVAVTNCSDAPNLMQSAPTGVTWTSTNLSTTTTTACSLEYQGKTAGFTGVKFN